MNPEFRRNLWLEVTPQRMVSMPLILAGIFYLIYLLNHSQFGNDVAAAAWVITIGLCLLWGATLAAESIISEVRGGTWENQRMSALTPWQLAWGKLFGGTLFAWYGTAICLVVYLLAARANAVMNVKMVLLIVLAGLLSQGISVLSVLHSLRKNRGMPRVRAGLYAVVGLFVVYPFVQLAMNKEILIRWYGTSWVNIDFVLVSLVLFGGWTLVGIFRAMRAELQMRNTFWVWALFVVWLMSYTAGFGRFSSWMLPEWYSRTAIACFTGLALFYITVFIESKDPVHFSRLLSALRGRDHHQLQGLIPNWLTVLLLTAVAVVASFVTEPRNTVLSGSMFFLSALLFAVRDLGIILALNFGKRRNRADVAAVIYLAVLYWLLPAIVAALSMGQATVLFYPQADADAPLAMLAAVVEAACALWMMRRRWRNNYAVASAHPGHE